MLVGAGIAFAAPGAPASARRINSACRVPHLTGLTVSEARRAASRARCSLRLSGHRVVAPEIQTVAAQNPARDRRARLVTLRVNPLCPIEPGPSEVISVGPTELIAGLFLSGGPSFPPRSEPICAPQHLREPWAGTITVLEANTGASVADETVARGDHATIPLAPGTYTVQATFLNALQGERHLQTLPEQVQIVSGETTRHNLWLNVP